MRPRIYTPAQLTALASFPLVDLAPSRRIEIAAHVPFTIHPPSTCKSDRDATSARAYFHLPSTPSSSSSPSPRLRKISAEDSAQITDAPKANINNTEAFASRRRRAGSKASAAKLCASAANSVHIEGRRREGHGAS